jgi:hypothetical protein
MAHEKQRQKLSKKKRRQEDNQCFDMSNEFLEKEN